MDPSDLAMLEDFGQRVDLTRRIREVLVNYPEGTTCLKELIQNADDAGATTVRLCLDRRRHGTASLLSSELAQWQGPALLAYNDAVFTEDDFASISRIGDSKKQGQPWKTGRFGVGFNSVYHLTDLPSFVSGKYVVLFDPQGAYLPNVSAVNPGKRLEYVSSSAISFYNDQFVPYCAFGCDMKTPFSGTLFRFPLRSADQAAASKLSRQTYLEDDISSMFSQLYEEAVFTMLFLKSITAVEMYVWETGANEPQRIYSCSVRSPDENISWHRQALLRLSSSAECFNWQIDSFSLEFQSEAFFGTNMVKRIDTFFIVQGMASASSKVGTFATTAAKEYDLQLLPWASVAACISDDMPQDSYLKQGQAFCFLPLPVKTGLPVQVNAYFEVSTNRRSIWYGADMDRGGKLRSDWNRLLLEDVVAPIYNELLLGVRKLLGPTKQYYNLWPSGSFEEPWNILVERVYNVICSSPVLHTDCGGGKWISPFEAFIQDMEFSKGNDLGEALLLLGLPIVRLPKILVEMLFKYYTNYYHRVVSPVTVRHFLKECEYLVTLSRSYKLVLLEYCLTDLNDADVGEHANGLALLPLANGNFGVFSEAAKGISYFICNELEYKLLSLVPGKIIDHKIPLDLFNKLSEIARGFKANIGFLDGPSFLHFFPNFFPTEWKCKNRVSWNPELSNTCPTASWFVLFWQYLRNQSYDLSVFSEWPILPSTSEYLYRASEFSKLVNAEILSDTMKELLAKIGCKILNPKYGVDHPKLSLYVYDGDASGVLNSIFDAVSSDCNQLQLLFDDFSEEEKNELRQFLLDPKWYYGSSLSDPHKEKCKNLPIYRTYTGEFVDTFQFSDLRNPKKYLPPADIPEYLLSCEFINCASHSEEEILVRYYGLERMKKVKFYKQNILNRLDELQPEIRDVVMLSILQNLPQLLSDDSSFKEYLLTLRFIPTINGILKSPQSLYDPRVEDLYALLEDSDSFPCGLFQESSILDMLLLLGLQTSVSSDTIIESARQVESLMHRDQLMASLRGKVLLSYLEVNSNKWLYNAPNGGQRKVNIMLAKVATALKPRDMPSDVDLEKFWNDLRKICWCPVLVTAPYTALPWPSVSSMVAPPRLVRLKADMWLVSASMRILDGECSSSALSFSLGWASPPGGSVIAAQLLELGKNNEIVTEQEFRQELAMAMPKIYALLSHLIGSDEMDIIKAIFEGCRWIWVGDGFADVNEVVLSGHLHLAPYIRVIPIDLAVFRELFLELGIQEFLKPVDYANILCRMATRKGCTPLDGQELRAAVMIAQHLAEVQFQDLQVQIYLPDGASRLFPATDLVFNDAPWLLDFGENPSMDTSNIALNSKRKFRNFVHGNISHDIAEKLGVRSLRRLLLAESSDSMNLSLSGVAEAFGQHEALTTRLKHIVEMYADGPGILFELVQNADDAQASEVVFLLDKTNYGTSSILSPEMAEWQGPALYCFNNSIFSSQDLYAISRIGQDSKLEKPFAIGRFGLGFNCVYHFTDIPGFVSGENVVIFDPHACYLPGISPTHPGLRIKFVGKRILEQFPDQFTPFLHFGCDLQQSFPGTLFRFPLRSESAASRSQIKKEKYAPEDVELLFSSFSEVVSEALLFLRNVKKITIFVKDAANQEMKLIHRVSRHTVTGLRKELHPLHAMLNFIHGNQHSGLNRDQFLNKLGKTNDSDLPWSCQKVAVLEESRSGFMSHSWMISECIGGGRAKRKSVSVNNRSRNFIPWASVAAYLHSVYLKDVKEVGDTFNVEEYLNSADVHHRKTIEGRAFCFLPLPICTGLPTHLNAYFELSSNRRDIWLGNDMSGGGRARSEWNICLLEDVIAPAYGHLLAAIAEEIGLCDTFFSFWPSGVGLEPWASMMRKLYVSITDLGLPVLYTKARGGQWISTRQAIFPDFTFAKAAEITEALSEAGLPIISISRPVVDRFMEACPTLHFLNPQLLRTLLIRRKRGFKNKEAMISTLEYCLSDIRGSAFSDNLYGLPLVPLAIGTFTMFRKRGEGERVFITSQREYDLLKDFVPHLLVDSSIPDEVFKKLHDIAHSGQSNLYVLTCDALVELFPRILPTEWQNAKQVSWTPGYSGQPTLEWMGLLWSYLKELCTDLTIFCKWPILPVKNGCLLQLTKNTNVIRDDGWSENMSSLLQKVGCFFLRSDLSIDHPQLKNFVQDETASGVLNAVQALADQLQDIRGLFVNASNGEMHELRSFLFQSKWFSGDKINSQHTDIIKLLPLFESYRSRELICLVNPTKWLKPEGIDEYLLDENFIRTESDREKSILRFYFGMKEPSKAEFYKDYVLNNMSRFLSQPSILSAILLDLKQLIEADDTMKTALSEIPFVLAANGLWQHPSRLYDPRVPGLQNLLNKNVFFPCDKFLNDEILEKLVTLGLKQTLGFTGLLDSARSVSKLHESRNLDAQSYGRRLLGCLNYLGHMLSDNKSEEETHEAINLLPKNDCSYDEDSIKEIHKEKCCKCDEDLLPFLTNFVYDISEDEFWSEINTIAWCPVYVTPPFQGLPWFASDDYVAPPSFTRPKSQMWIVSSKIRILDGDCCSSYLEHKLGWMIPPNIKVLSAQLVELAKSYNQHTLQPEQEPLFRTALEREIPTLYSKLQDFVGSDDFKILKEAVNDSPWVWIGDNFVSTKSLAFDSPVKYHPYLYAVPSELSHFRDLLSELGVKLMFDGMDYLHVMQCLQHDLKGEPLSAEQLSFVHRVLEAFADCADDKRVPDALLNSLLVPDSSGILMHASNLLYNDAPWMKNNCPIAKAFVHPIISDDLAKRLGVQSLCSSSLVDGDMMSDLPCMDYARICELLVLYGDSDFLLFDLLELADYCKARKLHLIYDKREHPRQSLLQHNLGDFQGSALIVVLQGATLSREEVCGLQLPPPWKIRGNSLNYGLGLISSFFICDLLTIVSGGYLYMFDPLGLALAASTSSGPSAKSFSLIGTDLTERFRDQFSPLLVGQEISLPTSDSTIIRMPLSPKCMKDLETGCKRVKDIFDRFMHHTSSSLLFLKSILQVSLLTWEEGNSQPSLDYSVSVDPSFALLRNPFSEKKWRKFQLSRLFNSSSAAIKMHTIDIHVIQGGNSVIDKWLIVLSLGSGQTRNMALDRRYLAYNLTPVAGVAALISQNGHPTGGHTSSCILSPLPLSGTLSMPVTALGCFLICHNSGRYLFNHPYGVASPELQHDAKDQLIEAWNREVMLCIRDAYVAMVLEFQKLRKDPLTSAVDANSARIVSFILQAYGDRIYSFWPRSKHQLPSSNELPADINNSSSIKATEADWEFLIEQVIRPFYMRLVELPVWQLYRGNFVKADEGMFLSQSGNGEGDNLPPATVCSFIKEHYPVFSVPWELVREIQAVGIKVREIKPKMVRDLLKASSVLLQSVETYIDVLDYSVSDIQLHQSTVMLTDSSGGNSSLDAIGGMQLENLNMTTPSNTNIQRAHRSAPQTSVSAGGDALEMMNYLGKALYDFGRGVVEDIGQAGDPNTGSSTYADNSFPSIAAELKGMPFPTATKKLARLGTTELWIGNKEQQLLMCPLADKFIHPLCLEKQALSKFLSNKAIYSFLKLKHFSPHLLSSHLRFLFSESWVNYVMDTSRAPWVSWGDNTESPGNGPNPEWIRLFWRTFRQLGGELSLISDWPLIPAFLDTRVLCRVKHSQLIFLPPISDPSFLNGVSNMNGEGSEMLNSSRGDDIAESELNKLYCTAVELTKSRYPWLICLLNQFNIPVYDMCFLDCGAASNFFPEPGQSLGQVILSKFLAIKRSGYFLEPGNLSYEDRDRLFALFTSDFRLSNGCVYKREEVDILRELPIYKTVTGTYTRLFGSEQCIISSTAFFHPNDERCLSSSTDESSFFHALGVGELNDQEVFVRFALPGFEGKSEGEQEDILLYLYMNWIDLQLDSTILSILKETNFVRSANELSTELFKPRDLLDPSDSLLTSVFSGERIMFPGERFTTEGWHRILRKTGLRTSSQADVIIECARKIEMLGIEAMAYPESPDDFETEFTSTRNELSIEVWTLAGSVVNSIFTNFAVLYDNAFCEKLGKIAFIPAEKGFPSIGGKKGGKRVLCSYSDAILLKDWPLAWSSAPILVDQNVVPPEYSWGAFHLRSPPSFFVVVKHLQVVGRNNAEDTLAHWPTSSGVKTVEDAFFEILNYLDKVWGTLSSSDIAELQKVPFVPVANGTRMVTVKSLFVRLTINLSPLAFELPSLYLPFVKILKEIGIQEFLSVAYAKDLLSYIQKSCGYQRLNPNELRAVMEILNFICDGIIQARSDASDWIDDAIIPDDGCRLVFARSCVFVDPHGSQYLSKIDTSRLRFAHPELSENICMVLGIKKLSDMVVEELYEEPELQVVNQIGSVPLNKITDKLLSRSLQHAVWIILNSIANHFPSFEGQTLSVIQSLLSSAAEKMQFVQCLYTRFLLLPNFLDITRITKGSAIPEWEGSIRHRTIHFVDNSRTRILIADPPSYMPVYDVIAIVVSQVLRAPVILPLGPLFACPDGSERTTLSVLKLGSESGIMKCEGRSEILMGKELMPQDARQVQFLPLRPFYKGEIIAWKPGKDGEKLRYGRVPEDVRPSAGQALYRFPVEIEPSVTQVLLSSQVLSFKSVSLASSVSTSSLLESNENITEKGMSHGQSSRNAGNGKFACKDAEDLQYGRVSTIELVQAVHDMLSSVGINMDSEKQTLLQTTLSLQEQLKESQVALLVEQEKAETAATEADAAKAAWSCRVCLGAEVNMTIVPCGHVLCNRCSSAVSRCPFCRVPVSRTMKIFRP